MKKDIEVEISEKTLAYKKSGSSWKFWAKQIYNLNVRQVVIITTLKENGIYNAAPKSWHMPCGDSPNLFAFACGKGHHTYENIVRNKEFAVNYPTIEFGKNVWKLNEKFGLNVDEIKEAGLTHESPKIIKAPLIKECIISFECKLYNILDFYLGMSLIIGEVVAAKVDGRLEEIEREKNNPFVIDKRNSYFYLSNELI